MATIATPNPTSASGAAPVAPDNAQIITPNDTDTFASAVEVYVGGAGIVSCVPAGGNAALVVTVPAGGFVPFRVSQVRATGTTATLLVAVY